MISPPHPTYQSKDSRNRILEFLSEEQIRSPGGFGLNVGSAPRRPNSEMINLDLFIGDEVDIQWDLLNLPLKNETFDTIVCTGVLEHVSDPYSAVSEIYKALKFGGRIFIETSFMQTINWFKE